MFVISRRKGNVYADKLNNDNLIRTNGTSSRLGRLGCSTRNLHFDFIADYDDICDKKKIRIKINHY